MRYRVLASDYDGTLAHRGRVDPGTIRALRRLRDSGRQLVLVTGRELEDLCRVFPEIELFDRVVVENGAVVYRPDIRKEKALASPPPVEFVRALADRGVAPLSSGRVIVSTWEPHETAVVETIRDLGLELQVIFNKGAVMVLPSGINKATGLEAALLELGVSVRDTVGVGDAENDHAFLDTCGAAVAVANALPAVSERADWTTRGDRGAGVVELIDRLIASDLSDLPPLDRHRAVRRGSELGADESFYFRGPEGKLHLRAPNLQLFTEIADGVDDATWEHHLRRGDYSRWFRHAIGDEELARQIEHIERSPNLGVSETRSRIKSAIEERYGPRPSRTRSGTQR